MLASPHSVQMCSLKPSCYRRTTLQTVACYGWAPVGKALVCGQQNCECTVTSAEAFAFEACNRRSTIFLTSICNTDSQPIKATTPLNQSVVCQSSPSLQAECAARPQSRKAALWFNFTWRIQNRASEMMDLGQSKCMQDAERMKSNTKGVSPAPSLQSPCTE